MLNLLNLPVCQATHSVKRNQKDAKSFSQFWGMGALLSILVLASCPAQGQLYLRRLLDSNTPRPDAAQSGQATFGPYGSYAAENPLGYTYPITDGTNVGFNVGTYTDATGGLSADCSAGPENSEWAMPLLGGTPWVLAGADMSLEAAQPSGATTNTCTGIVQGNGTLFFFGGYATTNNTRIGVWSVPLAGGAISDAIVSGDTAAGNSLQGVDLGIVAGGDGSVSAGAVIPGGYTVVTDHSQLGTSIVYNPSVPPDCSTYYTFGSNQTTLSTDGTTFAAFDDSVQTSDGNSWPSIFQSTSKSTLFTCASIAWSTEVTAPPTQSLPGIPSSAYSYIQINSLIVDQGRVFVDAQQALNDGTEYSGIFQLVNGNLVKILGSNDSIPGISLETITCPGYSTSYPSIDQTFAVRGNWAAVRISGVSDENCAQQTFNTVQAIVAVNLTTGAPEKVVALGDVVESGATNIGNPSPLVDGSLSPAGNLVFITSANSVSDPLNTAVNAIWETNLGAQATSTTLAASASSIEYDSTLTLTAQVTAAADSADTPTGNVQFLDGSTVVGTEALNSSGTATLSISTLSVGTHTITAAYQGADAYLPSTSNSLSIVVSGATPDVTLSTASLNFASQSTGTTSAAQAVTLTNSGAAALTITSISASGDFAETQTCGGSVAAGANCSISVTFTPTASGTRTGTLTITDNASGSPQTVALTGTGAAVSPAAAPAFSLPSGSYSAAQTVTISDATAGATIYYTTNTSTPTTSSTKYSGAITISSSETLEAIATASGFSTSAVVTAAYNIRATPTVTVTPSASSITTAQSLIVMVSVSGGTGNPTPTGSVTLSSGSYTSAAATLSNGSASINIPAGSLAVGADTLSASYTPDSNSTSTYNSAAGADSVTVTASTKTTPTLTVTPSLSSITTAQVLTVTVSVHGGSGNPTPTGAITLSGGNYSAQQALLSGSATFNVAAGALPVGSDTLKATYTPDSGSSGTYTTATQSVIVSVTTPIGSAVATVAVTPNLTNVTNAQTLTVTVAVSGTSGQPTPTGSATLSVGTWSNQQTLSSGDATFTVPPGTLTIGSDTLTAAYSGDTTYAVAGGTDTVTVSEVVSSGQAASAISPGGIATSAISFSAGSTYSGTMYVTCALAASPNGAQSLPTCSMNPTSVTLASGGNSTSTLSVATTEASTTAQLHPFGAPLPWLGGSGVTVGAALLFGLPLRRRRWVSMCAISLVVFTFATVGCGGGENSGGGGGGGQTIPATTLGNYTFTVTGTDSVNAQITTSTKVVVTVQ